MSGKYNYSCYNVLYCQILLLTKRRYKENNFSFEVCILRECQEINVSKKERTAFCAALPFS